MNDITEEIKKRVKEQQGHDECVRKIDALLEVVKLAYRKHHLDDDDIGWNELGDRLCDALCNAMGDDGFQAWLGETVATPNDKALPRGGAQEAHE